MTRDEIIRWSRSAIRLSADETSLMGFDQEKTILDRYEFLYWFAKEVAAEEREQCAKVCEDTDIVEFQHCMVLHEDAAKTLRNAAAAIRARNNVQQEPQSKD